MFYGLPFDEPPFEVPPFEVPLFDESEAGEESALLARAAPLSVEKEAAELSELQAPLAPRSSCQTLPPEGSLGAEPQPMYTLPKQSPKSTVGSHAAPSTGVSLLFVARQHALRTRLKGRRETWTRNSWARRGFTWPRGEAPRASPWWATRAGLIARRRMLYWRKRSGPLRDVFNQASVNTDREFRR